MLCGRPYAFQKTHNRVKCGTRVVISSLVLHIHSLVFRRLFSSSHQISTADYSESNRRDSRTHALSAATHHRHRQRWHNRYAKARVQVINGEQCPCNRWTVDDSIMQWCLFTYFYRHQPSPAPFLRTQIACVPSALDHRRNAHNTRHAPDNN